MNGRWLLLLSLYSLCSGVFAQSPTFLLGGIQVNEPNHEAWTQGLQEAGMNTVAVTAYAMQGNWDSDHLWWNAEEPAVVAEITAAKAAGLNVVFIARVALDHAYPANQHYWHGMIMPRTEEELASWFRQYTEFVVGWARQCEALGGEVMGIGSEMRLMSATVPTQDLPKLESIFLNPAFRTAYKWVRRRHRREIEASHWWQQQGKERYLPAMRAEVRAQVAWAKQVTFAGERQRMEQVNARRALIESHWRELIAEVRQVYSGQLTYAANFDNYHRVGFWDALDVLGINAYFPLSQTTETPTTIGTTQAWVDIHKAVAYHKQQLGVPNHPVLFTELGYTRRSGVLAAPWSGFGFTIMPKGKFGHTFLLWEQQAVRPNDRAVAVEGLATAHNTGLWPNLYGILYWKLTTQASMAAIEPFALHLGSNDPLEEALRQFSTKEKTATVPAQSKE